MYKITVGHRFPIISAIRPRNLLHGQSYCPIILLLACESSPGQLPAKTTRVPSERALELDRSRATAGTASWRVMARRGRYRGTHAHNHLT